MAVDYDLVIIGSSREGIYAAENAVALQARVALITQLQPGRLFLTDNNLNAQSFSHIVELSDRSAFLDPSIEAAEFSLTNASSWAGNVNSSWQTHNSLAKLAALGVDVIADCGEFCLDPQLTFKVGKYSLRSRSFMLATGCNYTSLAIDQRGYCLTLPEFWQHDFARLGQTIAIVGGNPTALALAQTLARFKRVILVVEQARILPQEDLDLVWLLQAQLEAMGVEIRVDAKISQIAHIDGQKWLQAGDLALAADEIVVINRRQPNIAGLNLAKVGVEYSKDRINVDRRLRTTNPEIFACGDLIGGYSLPDIAKYEASIILKNTLFFPWYKTNYASLPWAVLTQPNFARVGLSEQLAKQKHGAVYVVREEFNRLLQAQVSDRTAGMGKLLVRENGEILGCGIIGDRASELISIIALMMQHKIKLERNPMKGLTSVAIPTISPSMAEILDRMSHNFYRQKLQRDRGQLNRLRTWFSIHKNWHR